MGEHFDILSVIVIIVTFIFFTLALFIKGLTHDILLESAVFLICIKLIMMAYKNSIATKSILKELDEIKKALKDKRA